MSDVLLPRRGTLVTWTTQGFVPKLPYAGGETAETFTPFGVGLVQLGDEVRVEARLPQARQKNAVSSLIGATPSSAGVKRSKIAWASNGP